MAALKTDAPIYPFPYLWDPTRYAEPYLMAGVTEADVQGSILEVLRVLGIPALAVDAGAKKLRGRAFGALRRAGASTLALKGQTGAGCSGLSDIIGCIPGGRALFLEVKAPAWFTRGKRGLITKRAAGKPSPQQLAFLSTMHRAGAVVGVAWSSADLALIFKAAGLKLGER